MSPKFKIILSLFIIVIISGSTLITLSGCGSNNSNAQTATSTSTPNQTATVTVSPAQTISPGQSPAQPATPRISTPGATTAISPIEAILENIYNQVNGSVVNFDVTILGGEGLASGFVWDTQGHIVTNNHVVDGAVDITVTFSDGTVTTAQLVGTDPDSDLAVVKVDIAASELVPVQLADSSQAKVGQMVIAIGNPYGLQGTMTVGFISSLGRLLPTDTTSISQQNYNIPDIIQTDASINPGNSGGILVNTSGQVIGVPSAIISPDGTSSTGIGFAIPSVIVQRVVPDLINSGRYQHPYLGISGTSLNSELATDMQLPAIQRGALVVEVVANGPAAKAGLQGGSQQITIQGQTIAIGGDVIIAVDGQAINSFDDLITYLARYTAVGQTLSLTILRDGKQQTMELTLGARP